MTDMIPAWMGGDLVAVDTRDVHRDGLRHRAVSVFVVHAGQLLVQRRALSKTHTAGLWSGSCCSHPRWGEPSRTCAQRKLQEELGITVELPLAALDPIEHRANVGDGMTDHEVVDVFLAHPAERPDLHPAPAHVMDVAWRGLSDLLDAIKATPEGFTPWLRTSLSENREAIFG